MNTDQVKSRGEELLRETDTYIRQNPIPVLFGAVALGFAVGMLLRSCEQERKPEPIHDALEELRRMLARGAKKTKGAYQASSGVVREAVEQAVKKARTADVDDYAEPVAKWWKRLWS